MATSDAAATGASGDANLGMQAAGLVLIGSEDMPAGTPTVRGPDFDAGVTLDSLLASYATMGFQATNLALAIEEVNKMLRWRLSDEPIHPSESDEWLDPAREVIRYLVKHRLVSAIVTTAGAIEEDIMKCLRPHYMGDFELKGKDLRLRGINRIGNLLVPNLSYVAFEDWFMPILDKMHDEQDAPVPKGGDKLVWTPSKLVERLGREIDNEESVWYWAAKHGIPVFCPGITDGAIGDMLYFHLWKRADFILDVARDVRRINDLSVKAKRSGMVILGGGLPKHHTCNANLMRNGADYAVFINTGHDFDGSDSGAKPDEAVSWGKIRLTARPVKVYADATLVFPLLVAATFAKEVQRRQAAAAAAAPAIAEAGTPGSGGAAASGGAQA